MKKIKAKQYKILIDNDLIERFDYASLKASQFVIVTDKKVDALLSAKLTRSLKKTSTPVSKIIIPGGEASKSLSMAEKALGQLAGQNVDREAVLIALGGGIVGDLTGFIASIYKRGVRFVQIPPTLLAQVDSSIGAKNALNLKEGKNLVGTHNPPLTVIVDTSVLSSLPKRELANGLAEAIKCGIIWNKRLFAYIEKRIDKQDGKFYQNLVVKSIKSKVQITDKDPEELGIRKIINYGHTVGHALEASSHNLISHGTGVALGMRAEAFIANKLGIMKKLDMDLQNELLDKLQIKAEIKASDDQLISIMRRDKKSKGGKLYFVMPARIGSVHRSGNNYAFEASEKLVRQALAYLRESL